MIIDKLEKVYETQRTYDGIHISSAAKCVRQLYYEAVINKPKNIDGKLRRVFDNGNSFHQRMMKMLFQCPEVRIVSAEIPIPENNLIKGTCDAIVAIEGKNYVVDWKSINDLQFKYLDNDGAKKEHIIQVLLYMHFFQENNGIIVYENKNTQEMREFVFSNSDYPELVNETLDKLKALQDNIKNKVVPDKPEFEDNEKWKCAYCDYKSICSENGETK